jgi:hypothetical protein
MSRRKFWARGPARRQGSWEAEGMLTARDRCDRCGARAYVWVMLPNELELLFCGHHGRQHLAVLRKVAVQIYDETETLVPAPA